MVALRFRFSVSERPIRLEYTNLSAHTSCRDFG
jgi:hypothetical protein